MKTVLGRCVASLALVVLGACGGGGNPEPPEIQPPPVPMKATISGSVVDRDGHPVAGARVTLDSDSADTDAAGRYQISTAPSSATARGISVVHEGHAPQLLAVAQALGSGTELRLHATLQPAGSLRSFDAATAQNLTVFDSGAALQLAASTLARSDDTAATGTVQARITPIDPRIDSSLLPGRIAAQTASGAQPFEIFGALQTSASDSAGVLKLAAGESATLRIPAGVRGRLAPPSTATLYRLDETSGLWLAEGTATLGGVVPYLYYEGSIGRLGTWGAGRSVETSVVTGCVVNAQFEPAGAGIAVTAFGSDYIGSSPAVTDSAGRFSVTVKKGATLQFLAQSYVQTPRPPAASRWTATA